MSGSLNKFHQNKFVHKGFDFYPLQPDPLPPRFGKKTKLLPVFFKPSIINVMYYILLIFSKRAPQMIYFQSVSKSPCYPDFRNI